MSGTIMPLCRCPAENCLGPFFGSRCKKSRVTSIQPPASDNTVDLSRISALGAIELIAITTQIASNQVMVTFNRAVSPKEIEKLKKLIDVGMS
jgi:hypothetical protein